MILSRGGSFQLILYTGKMKTFFVVLAVFVAQSAAKVALSDLTTICDSKSPNLNACIVKSANSLLPNLAKGVKSFGFPPFDPLEVPRMDFGQNSGPVSLSLELVNTTHLGLSNMRFHSASMNMKNNRWVLNGTIPHYTLLGKYNANGKILLVPLQGNGKANFTFTDIGIDFVIDGVPKEEKSKLYINLTKVRVHFKFTKSYVSLSNLFNGNKALGETTSKFINENSDELIDAMKGTLEDVYSDLYMGLLGRIMSHVPYNELFNNV